MIEIVKINLDNEMDLILAHKRTMKLAELCGLSVSAQTTFATAVSEISRCAISFGKKSHLILAINTIRLNRREILATVYDTVDLSMANSEAFSYAKRLIGDLESIKNKDFYEVTIRHLINFSGVISDTKIKTFKDYFKNEPPISPYDEIRKKNIQLIDLSNKLQESEKQYKLLTDTLPLMMFSINYKGDVVYANKWLKDFIGNSPAQVTTISWQSMVHPDEYKDIWKAWDKAQVEKTHFRAQGRLKGKDGSYLWHLITIVPVKNEKESVTNWIGFFVDIHSQKLVEETLKDNKELKLAQEELEIYQHQLEHKIRELKISNENLEQFAFIASHDLQEPLRKIKTFSNLLVDEMTLTDLQQKYFNTIKKSSDRMSALITDVLTYSRLPNVSEGFEETDLNIILKNILIDFELLIAEKQATVNIGNLPVIRAIPLQVSQLFSNLVHNALKFNEGKPVIDITSERVSHDALLKIPGLDVHKQYFLIKVVDNGIGFDQHFSEKIFTIFQRLREIETIGTGIGLALCKKIVANHNGAIHAEGVRGKGAAFSIYLPE